jgi:hypothetical protein
MLKNFDILRKCYLQNFNFHLHFGNRIRMVVRRYKKLLFRFYQISTTFAALLKKKMCKREDVKRIQQLIIISQKSYFCNIAD